MYLAEIKASRKRRRKENGKSGEFKYFSKEYPYNR